MQPKVLHRLNTGWASLKKNGGARWQLTRSKSLLRYGCPFMCENRFNVRRVYTLIHVFMGSMLSFYQDKNHESSPILHSRPLKERKTTSITTNISNDTKWQPTAVPMLCRPSFESSASSWSTGLFYQVNIENKLWLRRKSFVRSVQPPLTWRMNPEPYNRTWQHTVINTGLNRCVELTWSRGRYR